MTGSELRQLREAAGISRATLAGLVGVSEQSVYRWETGRKAVSRAMGLALGAVLSKVGAELAAQGAASEEGKS